MRSSAGNPAPARTADAASWLTRMIRFENVTKTYKNGTVALRDVSLDIEKGEFVFLVGPVGLGQDDLHPPAAARGAARPRPHLGGRPRHRQPAQVARALPAAQHRLRLPGLPPAAEQDGLRERGLRPRGDRPARSTSSRPRCPRSSTWSGWPRSATTCRASSPAASSSAWRSPAPSSTARSSCWPTSRPGTSTRRPARASCSCSTGSTAPAPRSWWPPTTRSSSTGCAAG